jgi:hypothetical protein
MTGVLVYSVNLKLKGTYEQWCDLYHSFAADETSITLERLISESMLTLPGRKAERELIMKHLQDYAVTDPEGFAWSVYSEFVIKANVLNPLIISKARGGSPYLNVDIKGLKRVSRWLHVFLQYWLKHPEKSWPKEFQAFLKRHKIRVQEDDLDDCDVIEPHATGLTLACIQKVYCTLKTEDEDFYKNYLTRTPLTHIKSALSAVQYSPAKYPLKDFLKM